jgi:hypothetical protein
LVANNRRCPHLGFGRDLPDLRSVVAIHCIHFAVIGTEKDLVSEQ